jgi:hypothetical protein
MLIWRGWLFWLKRQIGITKCIRRKFVKWGTLQISIKLVKRKAFFKQNAHFNHIGIQLTNKKSFICEEPNNWTNILEQKWIIVFNHLCIFIIKGRPTQKYFLNIKYCKPIRKNWELLYKNRPSWSVNINNI